MPSSASEYRQGALCKTEGSAVAQVFESGPLSGDAHPLNKKVKCRLYLRDLQTEFGLSDAALQHIALISGPRCAFLLSVDRFVKMSCTICE